jgi:hypothetical protein
MWRGAPLLGGYGYWLTGRSVGGNRDEGKKTRIWSFTPLRAQTRPARATHPRRTRVGGARAGYPAIGATAPGAAGTGRLTS